MAIAVSSQDQGVAHHHQEPQHPPSANAAVSGRCTQRRRGGTLPGSPLKKTKRTGTNDGNNCQGNQRQ
jgi:hypothetical protein